MKTVKMSLLGIAGVLVVAGCETTTEVKPVAWRDQSAYMATVKDPRRYGYGVYQTPRGIEYRGGSRMHPNQAKTFSMEVEEPFRPVIRLRSKFGKEEPVLLDPTMESSWLEFGLAQDIHAVPVNEREAQLMKRPGEEIPGCLSLVSTLRLGLILIENPLVYVRMATGPLGSLARDIEKPEVKGVIGWDILKKFEQIHLEYVEGAVALTTTKAQYNPDPSFLIARLPLVKHAGVCVVRGTVDGKQTLILIDPAGDFEVTVDGAQSIAELDLGDGLVFKGLTTASRSVGGTRIGAQLLQKYKVTICPQEGMIYFEKPEEKEKSWWQF